MFPANTPVSTSAQNLLLWACTVPAGSRACIVTMWKTRSDESRLMQVRVAFRNGPCVNANKLNKIAKLGTYLKETALLGMNMSSLDVHNVWCSLFHHCFVSASLCSCYTLVDTSKGSRSKQRSSTCEHLDSPSSKLRAYAPADAPECPKTGQRQAEAVLPVSLSSSLTKASLLHANLVVVMRSPEISNACHHIQHFLPGPIAEVLNGL